MTRHQSTTNEHPWVARARAAGRPLVFAHRGGAALAPENTMAAFERAHALGVDGFELDVRLSRDGQVVVIHDSTVERTTDGAGRVAAMTAGQLQRLDAGFRFESSGERPWRARGATVPLLRDVLSRFRDPLLVIELKGANVRLARRAFEIVRDAGALDRVCFGGYARRMLRRLRRLGALHDRRASSVAGVCTSACREETRWALYRSWVHLRWPWVRYRAFQVPEAVGRTRVVSPRFVRAAHAAGLVVQVWTVNEEADMRRLLAWGVDGLITDRPDVALRVRNAFVAARGRPAGLP
jgi:glycerophosphoryl diester phosphodiesterase